MYKNEDMMTLFIWKVINDYLVLNLMLNTSSIFRYEPNYAPNVSLAPFQKCKGEDDDEDEIEPETEDTTEPRPPSPMPGSSKSYQEWDLSESDDSSLEQMSPADGKACNEIL